MRKPLAMEKIKGVAQGQPNPHAFPHRQPPSVGTGAFTHQITRFVGGRFLFPTWLQRVTQFHHVIKISRLLLADKFDAQQAGMFVGNRLVFFDAVEFAFVGIGILVEVCQVNRLQCPPLSGCVPRQPDFSISALAKGWIEQFVIWSIRQVLDWSGHAGK